MRHAFRISSCVIPAILCVAGLTTGAARAQSATGQVIYDDALENGWQDWGWAPHDYGNAAPTHSGSRSASVTPNGWDALSIHHDDFSSAPFNQLTFWVNGGATGGQQIQVYALVGGSAQAAVSLDPLPANTWVKVSVPLAALGAANVPNLDGFWIKNATGSALPTYYIDDIQLGYSAPPPPPPPVNVGEQVIYEDSLQNNWQDWSWAGRNFGGSDLVHTGVSSVTVNAGPYAAVALHHDDFDSSAYGALSFWVNGGAAGGQQLQVQALLGGSAQAPYLLDPLPANAWTKVTVPFAALGADGKPNLDGFWIKNVTGATLPTFYLDDARLLAFDPSVPASVSLTVDAGRKLRTVDDRLFGVNANFWDWSFDTPQTVSLLQAMGGRAMRYGGGSASDAYHWKTNTSDDGTAWGTGFDAFADVAKQVGAQVYVTTNYGSGTAQEAGDWAQYANVTKQYGFKYWLIGNEVFGSWENDTHARPHDPYTYATLAKDYIARIKAADPTAKVGVCVATGEDSYANYTDHPAANSRTGTSHNGWTPVLLSTLRGLGVTPDFVEYHKYVYYNGQENDYNLLQASKTWAADVADLRQQLSDYLGDAGKNVEIDCTENNNGTTSKQSTSLVNGLFLADSVGQAMQTELSSLLWWNLRNGQDTGSSLSPGLYGWRQYGDFGVLNGNEGYPTYYVAKLLQNFARGGDSVVSAGSDYKLIAAYGAQRKDGTLSLLVVNKNPANAVTANVSIAGYRVGASGTAYSYGVPQDTAARTGVGTTDVAQAALGGTSNGFSYTFAPYSATVLSLLPQAPVAPINLTTVAEGKTDAHLSWTEPATAGAVVSGYYIERSSDGTNFARVATVPAGTSSVDDTAVSLAYTDTDLQKNDWYWYRVQAFNVGGASPYSNVTQVRAHHPNQ